MSLDVCKRIGKKTMELGVGIHALTKEDRIKNGIKGGTKTKENGRGIFSVPKEEHIERSRRIGLSHKENKTGIFSMTPEQRSKESRKNGLKCKENKLGICGRTPEKMSEDAKKAVKVTNSQRWQCLETGFISTPAGLSHYQKKRDIDTSKRKRIT